MTDMMDENKRKQIEAECQFICEVWTEFLNHYHKALLKRGFTSEEALALTINL